MTAGVPVFVEVTARVGGATLQFALDFTPSAACPASPLGGCRDSVAAGKSPLKIRGGGDPARRQLNWKWGKGAATTLAEFGAPLTTTGTSYAFCLYDGGGTLVAASAIPAGGQCGAAGKACWRGSTKS